MVAGCADFDIAQLTEAAAAARMMQVPEQRQPP